MLLGRETDHSSGPCGSDVLRRLGEDVDGVMRAVDLLSLLSEARANCNVQCSLGRLSPSRKKQFRHDVIR